MCGVIAVLQAISEWSQRRSLSSINYRIKWLLSRVREVLVFVNELQIYVKC